MAGLAAFFFVLVMLGIPIGVFYYIWRIHNLNKRVRSLESRTDQLWWTGAESRSAAEPAAAAAATPPRPSIQSQPAVAPPAAPEAAATREPAAAPPVPPEPPPPPPPTPSLPAPPSEPWRSRQEWEVLIGGKWLNRVGAVALSIGLAFFLKYGFEHNWFPPVARVAIGFLTGAALLYMGARYHRKNLATFAQGVIGAGISILYLSAYATFNFYHLISQPGALVLMSLVTIAAFLEALRYDSLAVSLLGWSGGFLTPYLLGTAKVDAVGLFSYMALLVAGILAVVAVKEAWVILVPLTYAAAYGTYGLWYFQNYRTFWYLEYYKASNLAVAVIFLSIFWALFYALDVIRIARGSTRPTKVHHVVAVRNAIAYYGGMYFAINPLHHDWMGLVTLAIGAVYFLTVLGFGRYRAAGPIEKARYGLTAIILLVLATHLGPPVARLQYSGRTTIILWSLEALILVWCGVRWRIRYVWVPALALFGLAVGRFLLLPEAFAYKPLEGFRLLFTQRSLVFCALTATLAASAVLFKRMDADGRSPIWRVLHYGWCALAFAFFTVETNDYFRQQIAAASGTQAAWLSFARFITLPAVWILYSLPLAWLGVRGRLSPLVHSAYLAVALAVATAVTWGAAFQPLQEFVLGRNNRAIVLLAIIMGLGAHLLILRSRGEEPDWIGPVRAAFHYAWCLTALVLFTAETNDYFGRLLLDARGLAEARYAFARLMTFPAVWMVFSLPLMWAGLRKRMAPLCHAGLVGLTLAVVVVVAGASWFEPLTEFSLGLNYRALVLVGLVVGLMLHARWLSREGQAFATASQIRAAIHFAWCVLLFQLVTVETNDYFRRWLMDATSSEQRALSFAHIMSFPAVWLLYALPLIRTGIGKRLPPLLYCGLGALGLAVGLTAVRGASFEPIQHFTLAFNYRAGVMVPVLLGVAITTRWLREGQEGYRWAEWLRPALVYAGCILLFQFVTVEANDFFQHKLALAGAAGPQHAYLSFSRLMWFPAVWVAYSLPLIAFGLRRKASPMLYCGLAALTLGVGMGAARGVTFAPIDLFAFGLNPRAAVLLLLMIGLWMCVLELKGRQGEYTWGEQVVLAMQVAIALLALELVTVETRDYFTWAIAVTRGTPGAAIGTDLAARITQLKNLHQLALSLVWLLYSIGIIAVGMWRRKVAFRIVAIMVFGVSILKIFAYDLSFLQTFYRMFSFIGLGAILLLVSYLYQRYKTAIFGTALRGT